MSSEFTGKKQFKLFYFVCLNHILLTFSISYHHMMYMYINIFHHKKSLFTMSTWQAEFRMFFFKIKQFPMVQCLYAMLLKYHSIFKWFTIILFENFVIYILFMFKFTVYLLFTFAILNCLF